MTNDKDSAVLKPCPFCGETMFLMCAQVFATNISWWQVECGCGTSHACEQTEAEAIAAWNTRQPTQSNAQRNTPIWTEAATIQTNGRWEGKTARSDALREALRCAYTQGFADGAEDQRDCGTGEAPHKDCISEGFQNWLANNAALQEQSK